MAAKKISAKVKILLLIGVLLTSTILLVSIIGFTNFKSESVKNYTDKLDIQTILISKTIEQKMERYFDALNIMASDIEIDENGLLDVERTVAELHTINNKLDGIDTYVGISSGATYSHYSSGLDVGFNAKEKKREWFLRAFNGESNIITTPYISSTGDATVALAVSVKRNGEVVGVICINITVNTITKYIASLTAKNQLFVSRADGYLLASQDTELLGKDLFELHPSYKQYQNMDSSTHSYDLQGEEYKVVSAHIDSLGWTVWAWDKWSNANVASNHNLKVSLLAAFIFIIISLSLVYIIIVKAMYLPIGGEPNEIEAIVNKIAQGDLSSIQLANGKETGVYKAILIMVDSLKGIIEHINTSTVKLNSSAAEMSKSASSVTSSSETQMLQLEQTSTAMNEMTVTVDEVARNALQASTAADEANVHSNEGIAVVDEMNANILNLVKGVTDVQDVMNTLEGEIVNIGGIIDVISGISEQTNLLALNAAIEAARAGELGRGFAVVADEVRSLANRTKASTNEIQTMINSLQSESKNSVNLMQMNVDHAHLTAEKSHKASEALQAIRRSVSVILDMNNQIATAAEEQTLVAGEINESVVGINDLAKITFDSSKKNTQRAQELTNIANSLNESIEVFKL